jgi:hypothetical protein
MVVVMLVPAISIVIAFAIVIPFVTMLKTAAIAFPVTMVVELALVAGMDPACAGIRGASPISFVPAIMAVHRIPVAFNPDKIRARWLRRLNYYSRRRRRTDSDADTNLRACAVGAEQQHCGKQRKSDQVSHFL